MAAAAILITNLADDGTVSASSEVSGMAAELLITSPHVTDDRWRSTSGTADLTIDLGSDVSIDTIVLLGLTVGASATIRLRVSTSAGGSTSGDLIDTGALSAYPSSAYFDPDYGMFVYPAAAEVSGRYVRLDLVDGAADYVEAGRIVVGVREEYDYNFVPGAQFDWVDPSASRKSRGGQTLVWERPAFRRAVLQFDWVSNSQRWDLIERLGRVNGVHDDVLVILDPSATNLPQRTIWGSVRDQSPASFSAVPDIHAKQITVEERL